MKIYKLQQFFFILSLDNSFAQKTTEADLSLKNLYGDTVPNTSVSLNTLSNTALILPDTRAGEWPEIRERIMKPLNKGLGTGPLSGFAAKVEGGKYPSLGDISKRASA